MNTTMSTSAPRLYVGTYAKYNSGSIEGAWLDLSDYADATEFYEACRELHSDESDPEFMFQDCENVPDGMYDEAGGIDDLYEYWNIIKDLSETEQEAFSDYVANGNDADVDSFRDAYMGQYKSETDYAESYAEEVGLLDSMPENLRYYFDFEAFGRDLFINDLWISENGHVFTNR